MRMPRPRWRTAWSDCTNFAIWALDASTGAVLWSYHIFQGEESSPVIANGTLYVGSNDNNLPNH